ncbi:Facilitated trehalose transporter Tret1, partial [Stegodyphus mimosarum]
MSKIQAFVDVKKNVDLTNCSVQENDADTRVHTVNLRFTYIATMATLLYVIIMGIMTAFSAPATVDMQKPGSRFIHITEEEISWIASLPLLTAASGNIVSGYASQKLGRKAVLMYFSAVYLSSWLMIVYASSIGWIYAGRILCGFCSGMFNVAIPIYVAEISVTKIRGFLSSGFQIASGGGMLITMCLGAVLRWSWLAMVAAIITTCATCLMYFMPESPPWLIRQSKNADAVKALKMLRGNDSDFMKEFREISDGQAKLSTDSIRLRDILDPALYKALGIAVTLMFFQMFCGMSVLIAYTVEIFQSSGNFINASVGSIIFTAVHVLTAAVSSTLMDRIGRKKLYITSGSCMILALTVLGIYSLMSAENKINSSSFGWIPLTCFVFYVIAFATGYGPIPYVMIPEIVPIHSRSTVMAVACIFGALSAFLSTKVFYAMKFTLGIHGVYWTYALFCFLGCIFCYFCMPETKGKSINEINLSFAASSRVALPK